MLNISFDKKVAHLIENTGVVGRISFNVFIFHRLTHGCLESLQSEAMLAIRKHQPFFVLLSAASPESRLSS